MASAAPAASLLTFNWSDLPAGSYYLDIQMASGDGVSGNNSASIRNLTGENVTFLPPALLNGWASETQPLEFQITDDDPSLAAVPDFLNGILLAFTVDANGPGGFQMELAGSNIFSGAGLQDSLTVAILNDSFFSIYEENGIGLPMLTFLFDGDGSLDVIANASNVAPYDSIAAPQVAESTVPEPTTWAGAAVGLAVLALWKKRRDVALMICAVVVPASAQQASILLDSNVTTSDYTTVATNTLVQFGNDLFFAGLSTNANEQMTGLYKYNPVTRQGARFATVPVAPGGLTSAAKGLLIQEAPSTSVGGSVWVSDGTYAGTKKVVPNLRVFGGTLRLLNGVVLFSGQAAPNGPAELWRTDGSEAGTYRLLQGASISRGALLNGQGYFINNGKVWKSDGSVQGTVPALVGASGLASVDGNVLIERAGRLYFVVNPPGANSEFWSTDGTAQGTQRAAEVIVGSGIPGGIQALAVLNDEIYFSMTNSITGASLWKTNGTTAGTRMVKDLFSGGVRSHIFGAVVVNDTILLTTSDSQLWRTDGTEGGTYVLRTATGGLARISGGTAVFQSESPAEGVELWKTDGTLGGTSLVKDINPGPGRGLYSPTIYGINGKAYFSAFSPQTGSELWESDGTSGGTRLTFDFAKPNGGIYPRRLVTVGGIQYFAASGTGTCDIYRTDGTTGGTIKTVTVPGGCMQSVTPMANGNQMIFVAHATTSLNVWKTNGTQQGTSKVGEMAPADLTVTVRSGDRIYFETFGFGAPFGAVRDLYATDGESVVALMRIPGGLSPVYGGNHVPIGQHSLLFAAGERLNEFELYISDGTPQGTGLLADLNPNGGSNPWAFQPLNGIVYFSATSSGVQKLFRTDGTLQGTMALADIPGESRGPFLREGNTTDLFFTESPTSLLRYSVATNDWTSVVVYDAESALSFTRDGVTYFLKTRVNMTPELVRTDGTPAGTYSLSALDPVTSTSLSIINMFWVGNHLYLEGILGNHFELWRTDGVSAPALAWQINPRPASLPLLDLSGFPIYSGSSPRFLGLLSNGKALLAADDGVRGVEPWVLDDAPCSPAPDVNSQLTITAPAPSINRLTGRAVQTVRIVNNGPALNNVAYIASGLNAQHDMWIRHGVSQCFAPAGPYRDLGSVGAGQTVTLTLEFVIKPGVPFSYTPKVIAREGAR